MKIASTIIALYVFCIHALNLSAQDITEKTPGYNAGLGIVLINSSQYYEKFLHGAGVYGINIQSNIIVSKNFLIGMSADIGGIHKKAYTEYSFVTVDVSNSSGTYFNFFIPVTCYFLGNATQNNAGMYGKFGLGIVTYKDKYTVSSTKYHVTDDMEKSSFNVSAQLCIGGDVKLGKGRLFAEIVAMPALFTTIKVKETIDNDVTNSKITSNIGEDYSGEFGGRFGYVMTF